MGAVRTMEDFIRQRMTIDGHKRLAVTLRSDGLYEAASVHRDGRTATCEVDADPATALWNCLVPFAMRRRLPSGREVVLDGPVKGLTDDLDDLMGEFPKILGARHASEKTDDLEDLLG